MWDYCWSRRSGAGSSHTQPALYLTILTPSTERTRRRRDRATGRRGDGEKRTEGEITFSPCLPVSLSPIRPVAPSPRRPVFPSPRRLVALSLHLSSLLYSSSYPRQ